MIIVSRGEDALARILTIVSVTVLALTLAFMVFVPKPTSKGLRTKTRNQEMQAKIATKAAEDRVMEANLQLAAQTWPGDAQQIAPVALAKVTQLVQARRLRLVAFRPQRTTANGDLTQLPFLVTVEGSYPGVVAFTKDLEAPSTKLAVSLVQIASADAGSDQVTASVGLVAFMPPAKADPATTTTAPAGARASRQETTPRG